MKAKKSLGQNFLIDNNIISKIIDEVAAKENDLIIEIGPGRGALTKELKKKDSFLIAYELDTDLKEYLSNLEDDKLKVIYKDFLKTNINEDIKNIKYNNLFIVGNLPYYITTPIIEHIVEENIHFSKFTIMIQREVADRFMALPKSKDYGYMTLFLKYYFDIKKVTNVSKYSFNPVPKVESTVLSFTERKDKPILDTNKYFGFLKKAFMLKRKTLKNNLREYDFDKIQEILKKYNLSDSVRAEELTEEMFIEIFNVINH